MARLMPRKLAIIALALCLWVTSAALCAEPRAVIRAPESASPGDLVILDASDSSGLDLIWELTNSEKSYLPVDGGKRCVFASGAPGRYVFLLIAVDVDEAAKKGLTAKARHVLTIGTPGPTPPPGPGPIPPGPAPAPVLGRLYVSYVVDSQKDDPVSSSIRSSPELILGLPELDARWMTYSSDEEDIDRRKLRPHMPSLPCAIVQDATGKIVATLVRPDESAILSAVKRLRGAN
jgi:hypothetical protein